MKIESKRIESLIRYWVILEELRSRKDAVLGQAAARGAILIKPVSPADSGLERLPELIRLR